MESTCNRPARGHNWTEVAMRHNRTQCVSGLGRIVENQRPCESRGLPGRWRTNGGPWESHGTPWCVRPPLIESPYSKRVSFLGFSVRPNGCPTIG